MIKPKNWLKVWLLFVESRSRILAFSLVAVSVLVACNDSGTEKVYRIGILSGAPFFYSTTTGFTNKMEELGYIENRNIVYDIQSASATDKAATRAALQKFVSEKVDIVFVFPTGAALAAKEIVSKSGIPIIFTGTTLSGNNLIESIRRPGVNITGVQAPTPDVSVKRLEILYRMAPGIKRVLLLHNPNYVPSVTALKALQFAAKPNFGITLEVISITSVTELKRALRNLEKTHRVNGIDAILIMPEIVVQSPAGWEVVTQFTDKHNIIIGGSLPHTADQGALFSYFPDNIETGALAAQIADKVLHGIPAGTIPVFTPEPRLRINYKVAKQHKLVVDEGLLAIASEIIR